MLFSSDFQPAPHFQKKISSKQLTKKPVQNALEFTSRSQVVEVNRKQYSLVRDQAVKNGLLELEKNQIWSIKSSLGRRC